MADPVTLVESAASPVVAATHAVIAGEMQDGKTQSGNKNGKKADSGSSGSFFTWFIVLALLGVWTSVAVVYFDLVDYQGVLDKAKGLQINLSDALQGKLVAYDTDGDGDFDVEDAKVLLDEKPGDTATRGAKKETPPTKDVGWKLRDALKQQLAIIHERVEAKKLAKLALAEVRQLLAKEEEEEKLELGRKEISARVKERVATRLKDEEEKIEREEMEKALEKLRRDKAKLLNDIKEEEGKDVKEGEKESKKGGGKEKSEKKVEGEGNKVQDEDSGKESAREKRKKSKVEKSDRGGKK
uniref:Aspartyl beta-hydroxylase/Triadin domain-containing protein n=1 Tax=Scophthalmus maximus TaxID=52904 RepID=A0A8D3BCF1_SCOMX